MKTRYRKNGYGIRTYVNDKFQYHRLDGPALEYSNGYKAWYVNGEFHRLDGPAVEFANGSKEWWIDGIKYSKEDFDRKIKEIKGLQQAGEPYGVDLGDL